MVAIPQAIKDRCESQRSSLKNERTSWETWWKDADKYVLPDRCQWTQSDANQAKADSYAYLIDDTPVRAIETCASGLHSGVTNPSRPWFELTIANKDLAELPAVKSWLEACRDRLLDAFRTSNLYNALPITYGNVAAFGVDAMVMEEDDEEIFRFENLAIGTYWLSTNARRRVDVIVRELRMTVRQLVERFKIENVSETVRAQWNRSEFETFHDVVHVVVPNADHRPNGISSRDKRYLSIYYEALSPKSPTGLSLKGFDSFPVLCPRWQVTGRNAYGQGPGKRLRGHSKALQAYKRSLDKAVNKMADPPLQAPSSLRGQVTTQVAGGITYYDENQQHGKIERLYDTSAFQTEQVYNLIRDARDQINAGAFADLFMMIANSDRRQVTAEEIRAKQEEKLLQIGPVLENLNDELLDPLIARGFTSMLARGLMPEPPEEIQGQSLIVQYVSMMAQVQKMLGLGALDRFLGVLGNVAGFDKAVLDNVDPDKVTLEYHDMLGVTNRVLRQPDARDQIRQNRMQVAQQQVQIEQQAQQVESAKLLSETDTGGENALTDLINAQRGIAV